jgi:UDP-N-acetyl-D-glucosamine dehydrogenase
LNDKERSIRGSRILVIGAAYKPGVSDIRGAPTIEIMDRLAVLGADIGYSDPHVPQLKTSNGLSFRSVPLDTATVTGTDLVVVATYHKTVDWSLLAEHGSLILDARGVHELRGLSTVHIL